MRYCLLLSILVVTTANADEFFLVNGSAISGTLVNAEESPRRSYQIRLDRGGEVTLDAKEVRRVVKLTPQQKQYRELLARLPDETAELHWKMAEQCAKWSLSRERTFHLQQTVRLDPDHKQARLALKHKQRSDGSWAPLSEIMGEAGKVKYKGRWVTKQEADLLTAMEERREAEIQWKKRLKMWRRWLSDRRRREKAIAEITAIDDVAAVGPLVELFRSDKNSDLRSLLAEVIGRFEHPEATDALAEAALFGSRDLQTQCVRHLEKHGNRAAVKRFLPSLHSSENRLVRRAGYALGFLGDSQVVLPLIKALNTNHVRLEGGLGDGRLNAGSGGLSAGQTKPKKINERKSNREVRTALVKLTGQDFEYDEQAWLDWYLHRSTPPRLDLRRED